MSSVQIPALGSAPVADAIPRVSIGPVPLWVDDCEPSFDALSREGDHVTSLLLSRQIHAELRQSYFHSAIRLESMQAVQSESQWRLQFEPGTQSVTLHSIRIRRGDRIVEQADLSRIRTLQREEGLDGYVVSGWATLLLLLEDVRPKDIIESSYTVHGGGRILPDGCSAFFSLPEAISVARYRFRVCFAPGRPLNWKSSGDGLRPIESAFEGQRVLSWDGIGHVGLKPEPSVPVWFVGSPWIQISDCPDWNHVACAIDAAWRSQADSSEISAAVTGVVGDVTDLPNKIEKLLRFVQDEHRYLSVNLEFGGQIPTGPMTVLRRRFGDCKDLSFLLVQLLRAVQVPARPVLVHSRLRKAVAEMLPTPSLFDHVVVEFELEGKTRWVDCTIAQQGGGPAGRWIEAFGYGLPVDATTSGLCPTPQLHENSHKIEVSETLLLDTTGQDSLLAVLETHHGFYADRLRAMSTAQNREDAEESRRNYCARRFGQAKREGLVQYRDDRDAGVFVLAEVFRVNGCLYPDGRPGMCIFPIPPPWASWALATVQMKDGEVRRAPLAVAYPLNIVHSLEIESSSLSSQPSPRADVISEFFRYNQRIRGLNRSWTISSTFITLTDAIPAAKVASHLKQRDDVWGTSAWKLTLPVGVSRPVTHRTFGKLPIQRAQPPTPVPQPEVPKRVPSTAAFPTRSADEAAEDGERKRSRRRRSRQPMVRGKITMVVLGTLAACLLLILIFVIFR
jgi:transglutaminase-like putative cysteine protease